MGGNRPRGGYAQCVPHGPHLSRRRSRSSGDLPGIGEELGLQGFGMEASGQPESNRQFQKMRSNPAPQLQSDRVGGPCLRTGEPKPEKKGGQERKKGSPKERVAAQAALKVLL